MEEKKYMSDIHLEDYTQEYDIPLSDNGTMIYDNLRQRESLNGIWNYAVDQYDTCIRQKWYLEKYYDENGFELPVDYSFDEWDKIKLPCSYNTESEKLFLYEGPMVFTRTFDLIRRDNERIFLKIGAANYVVRIFLNGVYLGMHRGGFTP
nr:glycoside hydrolase family 2 [Lachnospiraceae bacterium]